MELPNAGGCLLSPVFSLNFRSAGKGPFMAGKAKDNMGHRHNFLWGGGRLGVRGNFFLAPALSLGNLGAKFSETSFLYFKACFMQNGIIIFKCRQQFETFKSSKFTLTVFNVLFPKCLAQEKKSCVYLSTFPYIHSFTCENQPIRSQPAYFLKLL